MSKVVIDDIHLTNIANSIRTKASNQTTLTPAEMSAAIDNIPSGGGGGAELPPEAYELTGDCKGKFANGNFEWFLQYCNDNGKKITTKDITCVEAMFQGCKNITTLPIDELNLAPDCSTFTCCFSGLKNITKVPPIKGALDTSSSTDYSYNRDMDYMFAFSDKLKEIPYNFFDFGTPEYWEKRKNSNCDTSDMFKQCFSLREIPDIRNLWTSNTYLHIYNSFAETCTLNKICNLPVGDNLGLSSCSLGGDMTKAITFNTNPDGTPIKVNGWNKNTVFNLIPMGNPAGVSYKEIFQPPNVCRYGITADKEVSDDESYQRLKADPDWFTLDVAYAKYNKTSALETIKSLPDISPQTATIKFKGAAGSKTDGGAINTLTPEEIAIASQKGWTVTLV